MPRLPVFSALAVAMLLAGLLAACGGGAPAAPPTAAPATQPTAAPAAPTAAPEAGATAAPAATAVPAAGAEGGVLRIGRTAAPDSLNPGAWYLTEAFEIVYLVYDTLITTDLRNNPIPQLAKEWSLADDGRTWTFKLHEGATWHDGEPVTSEDVVFTYDMIRGFDAFGLILDYTSRIESIEAPDPQTVVITFEGPVANTTERFSGVPILPRHIWEQFKDDETAATEFENLEMIGSGPFQMLEYKQGEFTRLKANKAHYLSPPKIDELIFRVYGNDDALVQSLRTGEVDVIIPPRTVIRQLQSEPNVKVEIGNQLSFGDIIFNVVDPANCPPDDGKCTGHPALRDVAVRQALAHATDKQALIDTVLLGLGEPGLSLVTPGHGAGFNSSLQDYAYDVEKAKAILEEAGYRDTNGDGIREMPNDPSKPLSFRYSYPSDQYGGDGTRVFELLRDMWSQAGVQITLTPLDADALTSVCCPAFDFDVINWGWGAGSDPASLLGVATTANIPTGYSETGYSNPEYDALFDEQEVTPDPEERIAKIHRLQEILVRDVPYIITWYQLAVNAYRTDRFQGWVIDPEGILDLATRINVTSVSPVQ